MTTRERTIGVVDIGSNTVHLLVASTNGRSLTGIIDESCLLRLGADIDDDGAISPEKVQELVDTLRSFQVKAAEVGVTNLHFLATYAIRAASNQEEVCIAVEAGTGLLVEVLPPSLEATFAFVGADAACPSIGAQVVVDIGGGSMQIGVGQDGYLWDSVSLPLGATHVVRRFLPSDPPSYLEEALLVSYLARVIPSALPLPDTNATGVVGVGGTLRRVPQLLGLKPGDILPHDAIEDLLAMLRGKSGEEIVETYNAKPDRARLLLPALLALREVWRGYDSPPILMSEYGIREGAVLYLARRGEERYLEEVPLWPLRIDQYRKAI